MRLVYLDNNATTPIDPAVKEAVLPFLSEQFGNPSSLHAAGAPVKEAMEKAREKVADLIGAAPDEVFFTSSGTEADNWAIKGAVWASKKERKHVITSSIEHEAVRRTCRYLQKEGIDVTFLPVDRYGMVDPDEVRRALKPETVLITIMHSNNEVGTLQPIPKIAKIAREAGVLFHTDAVQSLGKLAIDVNELGVDLMAISAHKVYALKGCGALYVRKGSKIAPLLHGGHQETGRRAGTENVVGIISFGQACQIAKEQMGLEPKRVAHLRDSLEQGIKERVPDVHLNGHPQQRLCSTLNVSFQYIEGESVILRLSAEGICASTGSACSSASLEPSPVLRAMGIPPELAQGAVRFSLGRMNSQDDINYVLQVLPGIVEDLRKMSPLYPGS